MTFHNQELSELFQSHPEVWVIFGILQEDVVKLQIGAVTEEVEEEDETVPT